jgi:hypothetical protein
VTAHAVETCGAHTLLEVQAELDLTYTDGKVLRYFIINEKFDADINLWILDLGHTEQGPLIIPKWLTFIGSSKVSWERSLCTKTNPNRKEFYNWMKSKINFASWIERLKILQEEQ